MRSAAAFLVLLLCLFGTRAQGETGGATGNDITQTEVHSEILGVKDTTDQTNITPDIRAELKELRDMVIKHSMELRNGKSKIEKLERENTDLLARVTACENKSTDRPKVAFSLGLTDAGHVGPFNTDITLKFSKVFVNFGQAYNPITGIFTAPVRGVYYFRFSAWEDRARSWIGANLYHNDKRMTWNSNYNDELGRITVTNALVLQLNKGDVVYMVLPADHGVWDDTYDRTTFSGFLLFSL